MTYRTIGVEIDDAVYQQAVAKAAGEGKTINLVVAELFRNYAGPVISVSPTPPAPVSTPVQSVYIVQSGDTLGAIARKVYGNAQAYPEIQRANNIQDPRRIWVGQRLVIPPLGGGAVSTPPPSTASPVIAPPPSPVQPAATPQTGPVSAPATRQNSMPVARFVGSPNFNRRPQGEISAIVMHATANSTLQGVISWFNNPKAEASAHYTIDKDGTIIQHVQDMNRAWHAGISTWQGRSNLNDWSIGIELVNLNNGQDPFPEAQHQAALNMVAYLCSRYQIRPELIVAHYDVSPGRKTDPRGYDMDRLRREVAARQ